MRPRGSNGKEEWWFRCRFCKEKGDRTWLVTHRCDAEARAEEFREDNQLFTPDEPATGGNQ